MTELSTYRLRVLGGVDLVEEGRAGQDAHAVSLPPLSLRALSALALNSHEPCTVDWMCDAMWPAGPPATAAKSLQNAIARIRRAADNATVETSAIGYRLGGSVAVDRRELEAIAATARSLADDAIDDALRLEALLSALWRGRPWDLLDGFDEARTDAEVASHQRRTAAVRLAEVITTHQPEIGVRVTRELVDVDPWDEHIRAVAVTALHRSGRRTESLREIDRMRRRLVGAGMEMGPELKDLQADILGHGAEPTETDAAQPSVRDARSKRLASPLTERLNDVFVGRRRELGVLEQTAEHATRNGFGSAVVFGPPGSGKTWLAARLAHRRQNLTVLYGPCRQHGGAPFQPLLEAFDLADDDRLNAVLRPPPDAGGHPERSLEPPTTVPTAEIAAALRRRAPVVLIVDDLQWADEATSVALAELVGTDRPHGVAIILLSRRGTPRLADVTRIHEGVARNGSVIDLSPFSRLELAEMITNSRHVAGPKIKLERLLTASGGSPLVASMLLQQGEAAIESAPDSAARSAIITLVRSQLGIAGPAVTGILAWLAIHHRPIDLDLLSTAARVDELDTLDALERSIDLGLVSEASGDRFELAHTTLRHGILSGLSIARRGMMHARLRDVLIERAQQSDWAEIAFHATNATGRNAVPTAAAAVLRAANESLGRAAPRDALEAVRQLLARHADELAPAIHVELLVTAAHAASAIFDLEQRDRFTDHAFDLAMRFDLVNGIAAAAIARGANWQQGVLDPATRTMTLTALQRTERPRNSDERARLLANLAGLYAVAGWGADDALPHDERPAEHRAVELADEAVSLLPETDDPATSALVLQAQVVALWSRPAYRDQIDIADRISSLETTPRASAQLLGLRWSAIPRLCLGNRVGFRRDTTLLGEIGAREQGDRSLSAGFSEQWRAMDALLDGDDDAAEKLATGTLDRFGQDRNLATGALSQLVWIASQRGTGADWIDGVEHAASEQPGLPSLGVFSAFLSTLDGDFGGARRRIEQAIPNGGRSLPRDIIWLSTITGLAEMSVLLDLPELAEPLVDILEPWHGTIIVTAGGLWSWGAADRTSALLHFATGGAVEGRRLLERAATIEQPLGAKAVDLRRRAWEVRFGLADASSVRDEIDRVGHHGLVPILAN